MDSYSYSVTKLQHIINDGASDDRAVQYSVRSGYHHNHSIRRLFVDSHTSTAVKHCEYLCIYMCMIPLIANCYNLEKIQGLSLITLVMVKILTKCFF